MKKEEKELVCEWLDKYRTAWLDSTLNGNKFHNQFKADNDLIVKEPNPVVDIHIKALTDLGYVVTVEKK